MRPCYQCKRFDPEARAIDRITGKPYRTAIGGCMGKGQQFDPDITEEDLGLSCDLFRSKFEIFEEGGDHADA